MLLALYPRAWRRRYGAEFGALLDEQRPSPGMVLDVVLGAIDAHLEPQVADEGEASLRRRWKDVTVMSVLSPRVLLTVGGVLLELSLVAGMLLVPGVRSGGFLLPFAVALVAGLLIGRWWAPLPFVILGAGSLAFGFVSSVESAIFFTLGLFAWAVVCLIGVGVRMLFTGELATLGTPATPRE